MKKETIVMFAALMLTACGGTTEKGDSESSTPIVVSDSTGGSTDGSSESSGGSEGESSGTGDESASATSEPEEDVSCEDACRNGTDLCGSEFGTYDECVSLCDDMGPTMLNCVGASSDCDSVIACIEGESDAGTEESVEPTDDLGETCRSNDECSHGACIVRSGHGDVAGYCSKTCEDFSDCPTFWECGELASAAGKYCIQE